MCWWAVRTVWLWPLCPEPTTLLLLALGVVMV
ncbi:MAG: PEP-CTERM sorting domain-containing protein [Planctomycetota bacterium]